MAEITDQAATDAGNSVLENAKEFLIGDPLTAFVTGTVLGFALAYGLVTYCPQARKFWRSRYLHGIW